MNIVDVVIIYVNCGWLDFHGEAFSTILVSVKLYLKVVLSSVVDLMSQLDLRLLLNNLIISEEVFRFQIDDVLGLFPIQENLVIVVQALYLYH